VVGKQLGAVKNAAHAAVAMDHTTSAQKNLAASDEWRWGDRKANNGARARCNTPPCFDRRQHGRGGARCGSASTAAIQEWVLEWMRA
jgi:hypothetical protein